MHFLLHNQQGLCNLKQKGKGAVLSRKQFFLLMGREGALHVHLDSLREIRSEGGEELRCLLVL